MQAQPYKNAIGLRGGWSNGITFKHFMNETKAVEGIAYSRWGGIQLTGLYQIHRYNDFSEPGLDWYYGIGGHLGLWNNSNSRNHPWFDNRDTQLTLGVDVIAGIQYSFEEIPFNISLDYKPSIVLFGYNGFWFGDLGLSVRYTF